MTVYLSKFLLPGIQREESFFDNLQRTCYTNFYPFGVFPSKELDRLSFEPITIFYGSNGSGKTTLLNVIAETIGAERNTHFNKSSFFGDFTDRCQPVWDSFYQDSTVITSDDVFDYIFDLRALNEGVDTKRDRLLDEYMDLKTSHFQLRSLADYEHLKKVNSTRRLTGSEFVRRNLPKNVPERSNGESAFLYFQLRSLADYEHLKKVNSTRRLTGSEFVRRNLPKNVPERSNGESAFLYFTNKVEGNRIYLLDEPENSLSAEYQQELLCFIEDSARFYNCQFIIATHSPFILAAKYAKIYDLDSVPVTVKKWTELANVRRYFDFFICQFIIATHSPFILAAKYAKIYDLDSVPVTVKKWTELANVRRYFDFFMERRDEF